VKKSTAKDSHTRKKHKRALQASNRRHAFNKLKEQWKLGIGLYETYTQEERDKSDKL
jgi:hypothetical protein